LDLIATQHLHNRDTTPPYIRMKLTRKMLDLQHKYNNCTTISHMRVGPTYWGPSSCEGLLYSCCIDVVQESNPNLHTGTHLHVRGRCARSV
jgi:hypothetical protein